MSNYLTTDGLKKISLLPEAPLRPEAHGICHICHIVNPALTKPHASTRCLVWLIFTLLVTVIAFSALTLLVGRQEGHPACKNIRVVGCWSGVVVCLERGADLHYGPAATNCLLLQ